MWILFSLAAMVATSSRFIFTKKSLDQQNEIVAVTAMLIVATVISGIYAAFTRLNISNSAFFWWLAIRVVIDSIAIVTNFKAFKFEEVTFVTPLISLLPVLSSVSSFFINHEIPSHQSIAGILLVVTGVGILFSANVNWINLKANRNLLEATAYTMVTILIWSFAEAIHKKAIGYSSPSTYFFLSYVGFTTIFVALSLIFFKQELKKIFSKQLRVTNFFNGLSIGLDRIFSLNAITTGLVSYVGAIKSSSTAFTAVLATIFIKEKINFQKGLGIGLATLGVIVIAIF